MNYKKILNYLIIICVLLNNTLVFANKNNNTIKIKIGSKIAVVNGKNMQLEIEPYIQEISESTMIPLRFVSVALGIPEQNIKYNVNTKEVIINYNGKEIKFIIGTSKMYINNKEINLLTNDNIPIYTELKKGTTFIPLKALSIGLDINIEWEANTKTVTITNKNIQNNKLDDVNTIFEKITNNTREIGSEGEIITANYIKSQLDIMGYKPQILPFKVYKNDLKNHTLDFFNLNPFNEESTLTSHNIIAEKSFNPNKKTLILSAHYDTTKDNKGYIDNASGVTVLLEVAKLIAPIINELDYNVRFIFFSSEEYYLSGSKNYISSLKKEELNNIIGCINVDMTSTKNWRELYIDGPESKLIDEFLKLNPSFYLKSNATSSDSISFEKKNIMNFTLSTVNLTDKTFDTKLRKIEDKNFVEIYLIKEDATIIFNFLKNVNIKNLY